MEETSFILFLNKKDVFIEKIAQINISQHFNDFIGNDVIIYHFFLKGLKNVTFLKWSIFDIFQND